MTNHTTSTPSSVADLQPGQEIAIADALSVRRDGVVVVVTLSREAKGNSLNNSTIRALGAFFSSPPEWARAAVLVGTGKHFSAGLDLAELSTMSMVDGIEHSRMWHRAFASIEMGRIPVVAALHGAVIGGGLELALAAHIRVADSSTFYALPEGTHGLFVGGGASVRLPRIIGTHRMTDMMLTGKQLNAGQGQAAGISQYLVDVGEADLAAIALAHRVALNADLTNLAVLQVLPQIAESGREQGFLLEALMAAIASGSDDAQQRMSSFLAGDREKLSQNGAPDA